MIAEFRSKCPACGEWIEVGDPIALDGDADDWAHEECAGELPEDHDWAHGEL